MKTIPSWRAALAAYIAATMAKPFVWGRHDCALFAAGAVEAMTGVDIAKPYRGKYKTLKSGLSLLKRKGFANHAELAASLLTEILDDEGKPWPAAAQVGDIAAIPIDGGSFWALGLVNGPRIFVLRPGASGLGTVDLLDAKRAFRVG